MEKLETESKSVVCQGNDGPLGHPKVYLNMGNKNEISCPYCSRIFILKNQGSKQAS